MDQPIKYDANGPSSLADEEATANLLTSSKNLRNARLSLDVGYSKQINQDVGTTTLKDIRRASASIWEYRRESIPENAEIMVYKRRWIVLAIFFLYSISGAFQWSMYSIIANIITKYYGVSNLSVDFTAMSFLISYLLAFLPAGWMVNNLGIRLSMILGCFLNALGCFLRVFSVAPDRFWLTMIGQCIVGFSQIFGSMVPTRMAAVWFPADQVAFACSVAFNGYMIGGAVGCLAPPMLVRNSDNPDEVAEDLNRVYITLAVTSFCSFLLTVAFLQDKPPLPPSPAQRLQRIRQESEKTVESPREFLNSVKRLVKKRSYMLLLVSFSLSTGLFTAVAALLNQLLIPHFPGHEREVGMIGLLLIVPGIFSSGIVGCVLDRTHAFKETLLAHYLVTLASWIAFALLIRHGDMTWMYISSTILGFSTGGTWLAAMEYGVEITYPEPEGTVSGLLSAVIQLFSVFYTLLYGSMLGAFGDIVANTVLTIPIVIGCIMVTFMRPRLKRQAAQQTKSPKQLPNREEDIGC